MSAGRSAIRPAEVCHDRITLRGRNEENEIPLGYLRDLEGLHDEWLLGNERAVVLDGCRQWQAREIFDLLRQAGVPLKAPAEVGALE